MKRKALTAVLLAMVVLTGCGSTSKSHSGYGDSFYSNGMTTESVATDFYAYDYDYSSSYITGDQADYSYTFTAEGESTKSRKDMLAYYESVQDVVDENDGFIQSLDNSYNDYTKDPDHWMAEEYKTYGTLRFTVEIPEENVQIVLDSLESFVAENNFTITTFRQNVYNYKNYTTVEDGTDIDWIDRDYLITETDLATRLAYSEISVTLNYYQEQDSMVKLKYELTDIWDDFWYSVGDVVSAFLAIAVALVILFAEFILFTRIYKKATFRHKMKHPEYYPPKEVTLVDKPVTPTTGTLKVGKGFTQMKPDGKLDSKQESIKTE